MNQGIRRCKGILFDLFHTLIIPDLASGQNTLKLLGISREDWSKALFSDPENRLRGTIRDHREIMADIVLKIKPGISKELLVRAAKSREEQFRLTFTSPPPTTLKALERLKDQGKKLCLVSNADCLERSPWESSPLAKYFDRAVFSCDAGYVKPEREIYLLALRQLNLSAGECCFVGDGHSNELTGARLAGLDTVFISEHLAGREDRKREGFNQKADYHIKHICMLLE